MGSGDRLLSHDAILGADDMRIERVNVPEWGGYVFVRSLTGAERDAYQARRVTVVGGAQRVNLDGANVELAAMTICDAEGKRLFRDDEVQALGEKNSNALLRIVKVAQRLNGLAPDSVEDAEKN